MGTVLLAVALVLIQCPSPPHASVTTLGAGCESGARLNATLPVLGEMITVYVTSPLPNAPALLASSIPPGAPQVTTGGCLLHLGHEGLALYGPFTTNAQGAFTLDYRSPADDSLSGMVVNIQAAIAGPGGADPFFRVTNAIQARLGRAQKGAPRNGIASNANCSFGKGGYSGAGAANDLMKRNFVTRFAAGLEVGDYDPGNGNAAPNGILFTPDPAGLAALETYLRGGGPSGAFTGDQTNVATSIGGGDLDRQAAALALNVEFNDRGLTKGTAGFGNLVFIEPGRSLSGLSVRQILAVANAALAGLGLPAGYSFASLAELVANCNLSFDDCHQSDWSSNHLFRP